jgi:CRP-like cAMP-binding protein
MKTQHVSKQRTEITEQILQHLPLKMPIEFKRHATIYSESRPAQGIYLILNGAVAVSRWAGAKVNLAQLFGARELFGYPGLLRITKHSEEAVALQRTLVLYWTTDELDGLITRTPQLGLILIQNTAQYLCRLQNILQSCASEAMMPRTIRVLIDLCERLGIEGVDGQVELPPITHATISRCVGTSREFITVTMNELRQKGLVDYSRRGISINVDALKNELKHNDGSSLALNAAVC